MRRAIVFVALAFSAVTAGCASLGRGSFKEPIVNFQNAKITGLGVTGGAPWTASRASAGPERGAHSAHARLDA